jgi:hypothetical protein
MRTTAVEQTRTAAYVACVNAWVVPGAGHLWLGRRQKGLVFFVVLSFMFAFGLYLDGRIFRFDPSQPLAMLASLADAGIGLWWLAARGLGYGAGTVTAPTYEYGNAFLIVAGLLNYLVILDVYDVAVGRK